ncbi:ATPase [Nemorincola caseinilytica]|uniref:ATPase n=1 Tax=Nemorincola caseinilytica TaxID=2054315 RepID=A0ABP8NQM9_9BACT
MASYLVADSGSTKTDWCLIRKGHKPQHFTTQGINPHLQGEAGIADMLAQELPWSEKKHRPDNIHYYGAGASSAEKQKMLSGILKTHFGGGKVTVQSDLAAAARALCGDKKGMVCILGTGSSSCYYDGKKIAEQKPSLGYIAGDEGSGNHMGKRILQYYAYGTFDAELQTGFEMRFGKDVTALVSELYKTPYPNRYLASFTPMLADLRGHYMVENIIEDCINDFFHNSILKYRQAWKNPLHFTGSVAYMFGDVIQSLCDQYELELGKIEKSPMDGLLQYYKKLVK